jgi:hypothetical protein
MNGFVEKLRKSQMIYPLKANYYFRKVKLFSCLNCSFKEPVLIFKQDAFCFSKRFFRNNRLDFKSRAIKRRYKADREEVKG